MAPHSYLPKEAGTELLVYNLATEYVKQGHEVIVMTGREPYCRHGGLPWHEKIKGVDVYRYHMDFPRFGRKYHWFGLRSCLQFLFDLPINVIRQARLLKKFDPDIINVFFLWSQAFWLLLTKHWAKKAAYVVSPLGPNDVVDNDDPKPWFWRILRKRILLKADKIHCIVPEWENAVLSLGASKDKCELITVGVNTDTFRPIDKLECRRRLGLPIDKNIVLYIARLWRNKGVLEYLEACRQLVHENKDTFFYLMGEGKLRYEIESKIRVYDLNDRFVMLGKKPYDDLPLWINACDVMVCVSLFVSFNNIHLEALACGRPVIFAADWEPPSEFVNGIHGFLVRAGDVDNLAEVITQALKTEWHYPRISEDWSKNTWSDIAHRVVLLYKKVLK